MSKVKTEKKAKKPNTFYTEVILGKYERKIQRKQLSTELVKFIALHPGLNADEIKALADVLNHMSLKNLNSVKKLLVA